MTVCITGLPTQHQEAEDRRTRIIRQNGIGWSLNHFTGFQFTASFRNAAYEMFQSIQPIID